MKNTKHFRIQAIVCVSIMLSSVGFLQGCAAARQVTQEQGKDMTSQGLNITNARVTPDVIELDRNFKPTQTTEVLAEVVDFTSPVSDVKLRFDNFPIEIKMKKVAGSTWRGELPDKTLKKLAVGDQTTSYDASIIAKNAKGEVVMTREPLKIAVRAPNLSRSAG